MYGDPSWSTAQWGTTKTIPHLGGWKQKRGSSGKVFYLKHDHISPPYPILLWLSYRVRNCIAQGRSTIRSRLDRKGKLAFSFTGAFPQGLHT